ncbi:MAG: EAL domain-containing protein [Geminocystis sp.]|nr:EAL domain-containing protein [Geminocystis sp.]MDW8116438.1 EAL domain-containing protein [Geminocystis sp.]
MVVGGKQRILIVDDQPENIHLLMEVLGENYQIVAATTGKKAIDLAKKDPAPDLIILDILLPDIDGYEVCRQLKSDRATRDIPIIFLTALAESDEEMKGLEIGAVDYLTKPINPHIVRARVKNHLTICSLYRQLQQVNSILEEKVRQRTAELEKMIFSDSLTGLPNRVALGRKIKKCLDNEEEFALIQFNFSGFSLINNSFGYEIGDKLLQKIGQHLSHLVGEKGMVARMAADNFYILLEEIPEPSRVIRFVQCILSSFRHPIKVDEYDIFVNCNLGIVLANSHYFHQAELEVFRDADTALHKAKQKGENQYYIFEQSLREATRKRLQWEMDLRRAIEEKQFTLYYQPIVDLTDYHIDSFEVLIRWQHPTKGLIPPLQFIPCLEESGLITQVGLWILEQACQQQVIWQREYGFPVGVSVNLSACQLSHPALIEDIESVITKTGINPEKIKLEITETALIQNLSLTLHIIQNLRSKKIQISLDDFGTGYSSLGYLHQLPVDYLKIDRSFIIQSDSQQKKADLVEIIILLAHKLGIKVVAEGCENGGSLLRLKQLQCEYAQGYLFSPPIPRQQATELLLHPEKLTTKIGVGAKRSDENKKTT